MKTTFIVKQNRDPKVCFDVQKAIAENHGHCPCQIPATKDTICPCKYFREELYEGFCLCELYEKVRVPNED